MRHNKKFNNLGRKKGHRESMLANLAVSLIEHKRINTTTAKAKELRKFIEPLLTKTKVKDETQKMNNMRTVFSYLQNKEAVTELFGTIAEKVAGRPGGYTRIIKTGFRLNDAAEMCFIELVDFDEKMFKEGAAKKVTKTRRSSKKKAQPSVAPASDAPAIEAPANAE